MPLKTLKSDSDSAPLVVVVRLQYVAEDQLLIAGGIDFDVSIDEDQLRLSSGAHPAPHHYRWWEMTAPDGLNNTGRQKIFFMYNELY